MVTSLASARKLQATYGKFQLYNAGLPNFPRNFSRDSLVSAILVGDADALRNQLSFCAVRQGANKNLHTGEEPGKIFHEYPGYLMKNGLSTEYAACDTTALYVICHEIYQRLTGDKNLAKAQASNIKQAVGYIRAHLKDDLFIESPEFCGAKQFALKVTFWKDSALINRKEGEPVYPVVYTLAHIQNMCAMRKAAKLLDSEELKNISNKMSESLQKLYDSEQGTLYIAVDAQGPIRGVSSDPLHALFYLEREDLQKEQLERIIQSATEIETPAGYRVLTPQLTHKIEDQYHANTVWPFEQAIIHSGAKKFDFPHVQEVSSRVISYLDTDPEILTLNESKVKKGGCDPQLWTIAAKKYFEAV